MSGGYLSGPGYQNNDFPASSITPNVVGGLAVHLNNLMRPGFSMKAEFWGGMQLMATYPVVERSVPNIEPLNHLNLEQ